MSWAPDYCTLDDLKSYLRVADDIDDVTMQSAITAASRSIDKFCGRQFGQASAAEPRYYIPQRDPGNYHKIPRWYVEIDDLFTTTGLQIETANGTVITTGQYRLFPRNAVSKDQPYTWIEFSSEYTGSNWYYASYYGGGFSGFDRDNELTVTAQYGWTEVPLAIKQATLMQANRWVMRRDAPFGIAGSPQDGSEMRLLAKLDPDVAVAIRPYYRMWGVY